MSGAVEGFLTVNSAGTPHNFRLDIRFLFAYTTSRGKYTEWREYDDQ
jgi:hypothetical protein